MCVLSENFTLLGPFVFPVVRCSHGSSWELALPFGMCTHPGPWIPIQHVAIHLSRAAQGRRCGARAWCQGRTLVCCLTGENKRNSTCHTMLIGTCYKMLIGTCYTMLIATCYTRLIGAWNETNGFKFAKLTVNILCSFSHSLIVLRGGIVLTGHCFPFSLSESYANSGELYA